MTQSIIESVAREELHAQVWATPMIKLAKQYGVSNVGLAIANAQSIMELLLME